MNLRVQQHAQNAIQIAQFLEAHELIANIYYPGLTCHVNHEIAKRQMKFYGGIISFDLKSDNQDVAKAIVSNTKYFKLAESLGGVKSLICLPSEMTHKSIPRAIRYASGVTDSLIRLSVRLEDVEDLIHDLATVLNDFKN